MPQDVSFQEAAYIKFTYIRRKKIYEEKRLPHYATVPV